MNSFDVFIIKGFTVITGNYKHKEIISINFHKVFSEVSFFVGNPVQE